MAAPPVPDEGQPVAQRPAFNALHVIQTARTVAAVASTRLLLMLTLLCAGGLWSLTAYDPSPLRIGASALFCAMVLWPLCWLAARKG